MNQTTVEQINNDVGALIDAWCARRAINLLRVILANYPILNNLTDDWAAIASSLKTIRVQHSQDLEPSEMETVIKLQRLAESVVYR
ncbi:MAG: hypothetical protein LBE81_05275 [Azonexus sp.]|jgi:hypothetical protein|uniref:hypothetical protein n=1 Tax=Azonexus sp. TaxID=1872668 RepID=UPI00281BFA09|nr:hypothetical protein [Azonexus sp.]MDR0776032.1 hypothetical protein [Azonexus sp.]